MGHPAPDTVNADSGVGVEYTGLTIIPDYGDVQH